jgi:hypothetical protein
MIPKTQLQAYGEFFYMMLRLLADPSCKHCHGRGYEGVQVGTGQSQGKKQGTGWEVFCHGKGCVGKTLAKYHNLLTKTKARRAKEVVK